MISPTCAINSCVSRRNVSSLIVVYLGMFLSFGNPGNRKLLQLNSCCFPLWKLNSVSIYLIGPSQDGMRIHFACRVLGVCFSVNPTRNTPLTSPSARLGTMNASVTMAALRVLFWMATWWASYGSQTRFLGILRGLKSMWSPCPTRWLASTRMARCYTQLGMSSLWNITSWDSFHQVTMDMGFILNDISKGLSSFARVWAQPPHV